MKNLDITKKDMEEENIRRQYEFYSLLEKKTLQKHANSVHHVCTITPNPKYLIVDVERINEHTPRYIVGYHLTNPVRNVIFQLICKVGLLGYAPVDNFILCPPDKDSNHPTYLEHPDLQIKHPDLQIKDWTYRIKIKQIEENINKLFELLKQYNNKSLTAPS